MKVAALLSVAAVAYAVADPMVTPVARSPQNVVDTINSVAGEVAGGAQSIISNVGSAVAGNSVASSVAAGASSVVNSLESGAASVTSSIASDASSVANSITGSATTSTTATPTNTNAAGHSVYAGTTAVVVALGLATFFF